MTAEPARFRLKWQTGKRTHFPDIDRPVTCDYDGPFGPMQAHRQALSQHTTLTGPQVGDAEIAWGPGGRTGSSWEDRLRDGIATRVGNQELRIHRPEFRFRRSRRALWVEGEGRLPARVRLRGLTALSMERPDGTLLVRQGGPLGYVLRSGTVGPDADAVDVAVFLLTLNSGLGGETVIGLS